MLTTCDMCMHMYMCNICMCMEIYMCMHIFELLLRTLLELLASGGVPARSCGHITVTGEYCNIAYLTMRLPRCDERTTLMISKSLI